MRYQYRSPTHRLKYPCLMAWVIVLIFMRIKDNDRKLFHLYRHRLLHILETLKIISMSFLMWYRHGQMLLWLASSSFLLRYFWDANFLISFFKWFYFLLRKNKRIYWLQYYNRTWLDINQLCKTLNLRSKTYIK